MTSILGGGEVLAFQGLVLLELVFQVVLPAGKSSSSFMSNESEVVFGATQWMSCFYYIVLSCMPTYLEEIYTSYHYQMIS